MYFISVMLLMLVFPVASICAEALLFHSRMPWILLIGKWFVFWSAGIRLFVAGIRQIFQPRFTSQEIFGIESNDALPIVRELGVANLATGTAGIASLLWPTFVAPMALIAGIFYGIAGTRHAMREHRNANENIAMVSDLCVSVIFAAYTAYALSVTSGALFELRS